jgi:predicted ATPase
LGGYIREAPTPHLHQLVGADAPALATLFPEIGHRLGDLAAAYPLPPEQARFRLFEAVSLFSHRLCQEQPLLLLFDDLQWADEASLDLLTYLVRHQPHSRLLVLGSFRSGADNVPPLAPCLAELERLRCLTLMELPPLSAAGVSELARHYLGAPLAA